jgi:anti-sigma regulatory factor (Ser/Thr protein kinase)
VRIYLPNSAHLANVGGFLQGLDASDPHVLDLTIHGRWVSVHPFTVALTAAMGAYCRSVGGRVQTTVPAHRSVAYLVRMGLFDVLGVDPGRQVTSHEASGRFIPLTQIRSSADLKGAITDLIPLLHAPPEVADPIRYVFSEMARNALEHARSPVGVFVCAQYYKRSRRVAIGIADAGIGIQASMATSHRVPTDRDAIRLALQPGISGTTPRIGGTAFNAGAGLFFTKSIAALSHNLFVLYSGKSVFKLLRLPQDELLYLHADPNGDRHRWLEVPHWSGTAVGIDVSVEEGTDFSNLLGEIRKAYSLDVKQRRKSYYKQIRFQR